jgi:Fe-S cluster assembly protein SufD
MFTWRGGQLDETVLSMQARGILKEAKALMYAFSNVVIDNIKIPELKQRITKIIANKLALRWVLICRFNRHPDNREI